jgi:uncharacterized phage protein (TIGR01671 family)
MREILFRGKRIDNVEWVEGYLYITHNGEYEIGYYDAEVNIERLTYIVDPATVGQYTGLTDKNGKRIFEGDVVSTDIARPYLVVEFRDGCFMFNCNDGGEDYYDIMLPILKEPQTIYQYGEVIGNIHDNPELVKEG